MISDARLVALAAAAYTSVPSWTGVGLDQSLHAVLSEEPTDGSPAPGLPGSGQITVIAFRGSIAPHDWALDFEAIPTVDHEAVNHPTLGFVHAGFLAGALALAPQVAAAVAGQRYALTGHSLGGALALVVAGLLTDAGHAPERVATFGAPKVGFTRFVDALDHVPIAEYRRGNDLVPIVPFWLPNFPYEHARLPLVRVGSPQANAASCHHIQGYLDDVTAYLTAQAVALAAQPPVIPA